MKKPITKIEKLDKTILKPRRRRVGKHARSLNHTCPCCMSIVKINNMGQLECTGNNLILWRKDFEVYSKMNATDKEAYLNSLNNKEKFLEWYQRKDDLHCGWSNNYSKIDQTYSTMIPDPIAVGKIERSLKRPLTEEELEEGYVFYRTLENNNYIYSTENLENWNKYIIPRVSFPDEV